jgi:hypothetical protein
MNVVITSQELRSKESPGKTKIRYASYIGFLKILYNPSFIKRPDLNDFRNFPDTATT